MSLGGGEGRQYQLFNGQIMVGVLHPAYAEHIDGEIFFVLIFEGNLAHLGKQAWCSTGLSLHRKDVFQSSRQSEVPDWSI
jgi:hypothetical protein